MIVNETSPQLSDAIGVSMSIVSEHSAVKSSGTNVNTGDVHLNLVDLPASYTALGPLSGNSGAVAFPAGLVGNNYTGNPTWTGPCLTATMQYKFTVFALSGSIGAAVNNMNAVTFESNYSSLIMYKSSMIGVMGFPD